MFKSVVWVFGLVLSAGAFSPAAAQAVYKCGFRSYSQEPCAPKRIVNTDDAPVPAKPNPGELDLRRMDQNHALAQSMRRLPGETSAQFSTRRHRASLMAEDRDECARLDTRIPFERERMKNPDPDEVDKAKVGLVESRKRFRQLRC